jgi:hypothetical protein
LGRLEEIPVMSNELPIPPAALTDDRARELVRVWASGGSQHVSLATGLWSDPAACGIILVDLARHLAGAYEQTGAISASEALSRIRAGFEAEWNMATSKAAGKFVDDAS